MKQPIARLGAFVLALACGLALPAQRSHSKTLDLEVPEGGRIVIRIRVTGAATGHEVRIAPRGRGLAIVKRSSPAHEEAEEVETPSPVEVEEPAMEPEEPEEPEEAACPECTGEPGEEGHPDEVEVAPVAPDSESDDDDESSEDADDDEESSEDADDEDAQPVRARAGRGVEISIEIVIHGAATKAKPAEPVLPPTPARRPKLSLAPLRTSAEPWFAHALAALQQYRRL